MSAVKERKKQLEHYRDWIHSHPQHCDPEVRPAAVDFLNGLIGEGKMKNARLAGRALGLRSRLRHLLMLILSQNGVQ